jgi:hypothetical protein
VSRGGTEISGFGIQSMMVMTVPGSLAVTEPGRETLLGDRED